ncbi:MAG TPA: helix-turn-helix transcriptional regulator, partial [Thermoanaerobaculia bacterium]
MAAPAGLQPSTIAYLEQGKREPDLALLERLTAAMGVSRESLEDLLKVSEEIRTGPGSGRWLGPVFLSDARMRKTEMFARRLARISTNAFRESLLRAWVEGQAEKDREKARELGSELKDRHDLVDLVSSDARFHLWAVAEWLCEESMKLAPRNRELAAESAAAALAVAERAAGEERFKLRLGGYCWAHIGSVRRVRPGAGGLR